MRTASAFTLLEALVALTVVSGTVVAALSVQAAHMAYVVRESERSRYFFAAYERLYACADVSACGVSVDGDLRVETFREEPAPGGRSAAAAKMTVRGKETVLYAGR